MQNGPLGFCVVERHKTIPETTYGALREFRTCDISDAMNRSHTMYGIAAAYQPVERLVGPAVTVSLPGSGFQMIDVALLNGQPGDVLVISTQGSVQSAYWGGDMTRLAIERGFAGVVIDGALRDRDEIQAAQFPAFTRSFATRAAVVEASWGEVNMPIACGGIAVSPGDIIVADAHGVVAVPEAWVERAVHDVTGLVHGGFELPPLEGVADKLRADGLLTLDTPAG